MGHVQNSLSIDVLARSTTIRRDCPRYDQHSTTRRYPVISAVQGRHLTRSLLHYRLASGMPWCDPAKLHSGRVRYELHSCPALACTDLFHSSGFRRRPYCRRVLCQVCGSLGKLSKKLMCRSDMRIKRPSLVFLLRTCTTRY